MKTALLLIDIQNDYFPGGRMELFQAEKASMQARKILEFFREQKLPIFHIQHIAVQEGATFFLPESEGVNIHKNVSPKENEQIVTKHYPNCFRQTNLLELLYQNGIEHVVLCGMMSHMCVDATTRAAFDQGFSCTVIEDACTTRDLMFDGHIISARDVHDSFMAALNGTYAKVIKAETYTTYL